MTKVIGRSRPSGLNTKLYFTDFSINMPAYDVTSFGNSFRSIVTELPEIEFSGVMTATEGSHEIMMALLNGGGIDFMQERQEWRCV